MTNNETKETLGEMFDILNNEKMHEVIKIYNSRKIDEKYKIDLVLLFWKKSKQKILECRKMYYKEKNNEWVMGGRTGIGIEELNIISENIEDIKKQISS